MSEYHEKADLEQSGEWTPPHLVWEGGVVLAVLMPYEEASVVFGDNDCVEPEVKGSPQGDLGFLVRSGHWQAVHAAVWPQALVL